MKRDSQTIDWSGPKGWKGRALRDYQNFPIHELPWANLRREGSAHENVQCVKSSNSRRVLRVLLPAASGEHSRVVYVKRYRINTLRRRVGTRLLGNKAVREFELGHGLLRAGIATPLPLAWAEHRTAVTAPPGDDTPPLPPAAYLLTLEWPNNGSVADWLAAHPAERDRIVRPLADFLAFAHDRGFYHDDCAAQHILVADSARFDEAEAPTSAFGFIDLDNGRLSSRPLASSARLSNLFQVLRSIPPQEFPTELRIALIENYRDFWNDSGAPQLDDCIGSIERQAFRKVGRPVVKV
jgi:hypothetical protein